MTAPRWAVALLQWIAPPGRGDDLVGDLNEMHHRRVRQFGRMVANTLSAFAATDMAVALFRQRIRSNDNAQIYEGLKPV